MRATSERMRQYAIAAACMLAFTAAQGAINPPTGFNVEPDMLGFVRLGMAESDVRTAVGQPAKVRRYGNQAGPTWVYGLLDHEKADWHVDFGADGRVLATHRWMLPLGDAKDE